MRRVLQAAKCSQMTNPSAATGSGGNRCTESCGAMIDATYKIGPWAKDGKHTVEQIMYQFTENLNAGSDSSRPENASWIGTWLQASTAGAITLGDVQWPTFKQVMACIDQGHIAIGGFDNYINLRLSNGGDPYTWPDTGNYAATHQGEGHVLIIVGYDDVAQVIVVHDPLRADPGGQPADYSWSGFQAAKFHDLCEVTGPALPFLQGGTSMVPAGWSDDGTTLKASNGVVVVRGFRDYLLAYPGGWHPSNLPIAPEYGWQGGTRQDFTYSSRGWSAAKGQFDIPIGAELAAANKQLATVVQAPPPAPPPAPAVPADVKAWFAAAPADLKG